MKFQNTKVQNRKQSKIGINLRVMTTTNIDMPDRLKLMNHNISKVG